MVNALVKKGIDAKYISSFEEIESYLLDRVQNGDIIVTMGAGNVYAIGESLLKSNEKEAI